MFSLGLFSVFLFILFMKKPQPAVQSNTAWIMMSCALVFQQKDQTLSNGAKTISGKYVPLKSIVEL